MERKTWVMPMTLVQKFEANESVAATNCWAVGCDTVAANALEKSSFPQYAPSDPAHWFPYYSEHGADSCGVSTHQFVRDIDGNGTPDKMYELKNGQELECSVFTDPSYTNPITVSSIKPGQTIYWTTVMDVGGLLKRQTWHHQGKVELTYPSHPNRS